MIALNPVAETGTSQTPASAQQPLGKDDFLQLLVAQLSAQDPLNPADSQEFSAQLAQFSSLEQITNVNTTLQEIKLSQDSLGNASMISLIGKNVDVPGNSFTLNPGKDVSLNYTLDETADSVYIDVFNAGGELITSLDGGTESGTNLVPWGGANGEGGNAPAGTYTFAVRAIDANGNPVESETFTSGEVTDVLFENNEAFAVVNEQKIAASNISRVSSN